MSQTADDVFVDDDMRFVTVIDRTGLGGDIALRSGTLLQGTLYWDHKPHTIKATPFQLRAPAALHFFKYGSQAWLHDASGAYVCRLGIVEGDEELIAQIGPEMVTADPIDVDQEAVEGWDTAAVDPTNRKITKRVKRTERPSMGELRAREEG